MEEKLPEEKSLPHVYAMNHSPKKWACQYYRYNVPLESFAELGYARTWVDDGAGSRDETVHAMAMSDYCLFWGLACEEFHMQMRDIKAITPTQDANGVLHFRPTLIYDVDDNRDYIHPFNTAYAGQGVRIGKRLLVPGESVETPDPITGKMMKKWEDKKTWSEGIVFDIERNLQNMVITHNLLRDMDGLTTTSPHLSSYYQKVVGVKNVYTFPNTIIPDHYVSYDLVRKDDRVRILWQGGESHAIDWFPILPAIKEICEKYDNIVFVMFGHLDERVAAAIPHDRIEFHDWVDYSAYKLKRALLNIDINLCPLADNFFNRCKSAIKWYEGSVWDKPEATIAGNVPPYSEEMKHNETGLLYSSPREFGEQLAALIENAELRHKLGHNAKKWVLSHRTPAQTVPPLWDFYKSLKIEQIDKYRLTFNYSRAEVQNLLEPYNGYVFS